MLFCPSANVPDSSRKSELTCRFEFAERVTVPVVAMVNLAKLVRLDPLPVMN